MENRQNKPPILTYILVSLNLVLYDLLTNKGVVEDVKLPTKELINIINLEKDLREQVYYQNEALNTIIDGLHQFNDGHNVFLINLVGPTGVGKTFTSNLIRKHFSNIDEISMPFITYDKLKKFDKESVKLIIVDNLIMSDIQQLLEFIKLLPKNRRILVIPIVNIQETDSNLNHSINYKNINKIQNLFNEHDFYYKIAAFYELNKKQASDWMHKELNKKRRIDSKEHMFIDQILDNQDIKHHGLKGLYSKMYI